MNLHQTYARLTINGRRLYGRKVGDTMVAGQSVSTWIRANKDGSDWERETAAATQREMLVGPTVGEELFYCLHYGELLPRSECKRPLVTSETPEVAT